ncbi:MAG: GGDEF domain-containing protein [Actinobacteria bacterium]|nr:GGDEF domain-containing protein [Actinomycetota bacterium]
MSAQERRATTSRRRSAATAAIVTTSLLGAGGAAMAANSSRHDADRARTDAQAVEVIELRSELRRVHLHETNEVMLQAFGVATAEEVEAARDERVATRARAADRLLELQQGSGSTAGEALFLYDLISQDGLDGVRAADPGVLFDTGRAAARDGRPPDEALTQESLALHDLMRTDAAPLQILNDAIDAAYTMEKPEVDDLLAEYVSRSEPYILSDGGYLGPDAEAPLVDSYVFDGLADVPSPAVEAVSDRLVASDLWTYDQWVRSWQEAVPGEPPLTLAELAAHVDEVEGDIQRIVADTLTDARAEHEAAATSASRWAVLLFGLAGVLGILGSSLLVLAVLRRIRAMSRAVSRVSVDPLTGAGNRHQLELDTVGRVQDPAYSWHLLAAIDMDRFKLINDTWGHSVGDAVLVEVAQRLGIIVADWRAGASGHHGAVIRLGGDEFLLVLHAKSPMNESLVAAQLDEIRTSTLGTADGQLVDLAFSVGIVTADGQSDLDDLMRAADLAAYEDKAARRAQREEPFRQAAADEIAPDRSDSSSAS